jgi:hypothetical protein
MASVEIVPIAQDHIESFHRALDFVARERRYLAFLEAPPLESMRAFVLDNISRVIRNWSRCRPARSSAGAMSCPSQGRFMRMAAFSASRFCRNSGGRE